MRAINLAVVALGFAAIATVAVAIKRKAPEAAPVEVQVYRPVTSDLMNAYIQPRHTKLFLAGAAQNWAFAEYERHNIGGALNRLADAVPEYKGQSMKDLIAAFATPQLAALDEAIKAKDPTAFRAAYEALTTGCNRCHEATEHSLVVLQSAATNTFPDQVFRAVGH